MKYANLEPNSFPASLDPGTILQPERPVVLPLPWAEPLDLHHTFRCGQVFRWREEGGTWYGPYRGGSLAVRHTLSGVEVRALGVEATAGEAWRFLGLDHSLGEIYRCIGDDRWLLRAIETVPGLRILRQDPWECLAGFICSQNSNIPKIELSLERIARLCVGVLRWPEGVEVAAFPSAARLAELSPDALKETALGYRCSYLSAASGRIAAGEVDLLSLRGHRYEEALAALLALPGVGRKVADCILLFSLDQAQAFPVDVWVRRVLRELYPKPLARYLPDLEERGDKALTAREYEAMVQFAWRKWGALAGYAQMYLFHARRLGGLAVSAP